MEGGCIIIIISHQSASNPARHYHLLWILPTFTESPLCSWPCAGAGGGGGRKGEVGTIAWGSVP